LSDTSHLNWREADALARQEKDPAQIPEICARARRLIQNRQLELATFSHMHDDEITELEAALRELWVMEQRRYKKTAWAIFAMRLFPAHRKGRAEWGSRRTEGFLSQVNAQRTGANLGHRAAGELSVGRSSSSRTSLSS
jgi:hypothetical protein